MRKTNIILCAAALAVCLASFYFVTADSVFTVHDDILTYMQVQHGRLWHTAVADAQHGRIGHIPLTYLLYIPYFFRSTAAVRLFSLASVIFDITGLYCLVKNNADRKPAFLSCIAFISFACISNQHNLFVSYTVGHQIPSGMILFSLNEFTKFYSDRNRKIYLLKSALLLFAASFLYEACAAYIIMYILYAGYRRREGLRKNIPAIFRDVSFHFAVLIVYAGIYLGWRRFYPSDYDGSVLYFGNIPLSLLTMVKYSFGMIPGLPAAAMYIKKYITAEELKNSIDLWMLAAPAVTAAVFCCIFPKIKININKGFLLVFCISGIIIPNIIISFTPKYTEWAAGSSYSYVTSFYSYFFLIPLALIILKMIFRKNGTAGKIFLGCAVFAVSLVCTVNNAAWNCYFEKNLARYEVFSQAVSSDYFDRLEDGTTVYIPDYTGIHNDMSITKTFASLYTGSDIEFTNSESEIDFSGPVIILKYDYENRSLECGSLNDDYSYTAEYVFTG